MASSNAVQAFRLARHCCVFVAQQIELDKLRGGRDVDFVLDELYRDSAGRQFRFRGFKQEQGYIACQYVPAGGEGSWSDDRFTGQLSVATQLPLQAVTDVQDIRRPEKRYAHIAPQDRQRRSSAQGDG